MNTITLNAYAKINLSLDIIGKLENGYHSLEMVMQSISLHDIVTVKKTRSNIRIFCDDPTVPTDRRNITYKCAESFLTRYDINGGADIEIQKHIPSQAGMAGGSADGAAILHALNTLYETACTDDDLIKLGVEIGADIPFCIKGGTLLAKGIGEQLTELPVMPDCFIAAAKPNCGVDTANAFAAYDSSPSHRNAGTNKILSALDLQSLPKIGAYLCNALESVCIPDKSKDIKSVMLKSSAHGALMTGSGSAVYGLFSTRKSAESCLDKINAPFKAVCRPVGQGVKIIKSE